MPDKRTTTTVRVPAGTGKRRLVKRVRKVVIRTVFVKGAKIRVRRRADGTIVVPAQVIDVDPAPRELPRAPVSELTVKERRRLPVSRR